MPDLSGVRFSETHEWVREEGGSATVGITDYAQSQLGDVIYLELPKVGDRLEPAGKFGVIESVKAASDLYLPCKGTVIEVNEALAKTPGLVNDDPYGAGWLVKVKVVEPPAGLLDEAAYKAAAGAGS